MTTTAEALFALTPLQAAAPAASRIDSVLVAEAAADNALNADATEVEAHVAITAEARIAPTLVQVASPAASRVESVMAAQATTNNSLNADATEVEL